MLCYLLGKTQDEAALLLGLSKGTLKRRLERGRGLLRERLGQRGLGPSALLVVSAWPAATAQAWVPQACLQSTVKAATNGAAGGAATPAASARVANLTEGVLKTMSLSKCKIAAALLIVAAAGLAFVLELGGNGRPPSRHRPQRRSNLSSETSRNSPSRMIRK